MTGLPDLPTPGGSDPEASPGVDTAAIAGIVRTRLFEDQPHRIGRFAVLERLGAGGMGVVYAAFDAELDRRVAIKLLFAGADDGRRLAREAQIMARLNHPNVAQIYEVGGLERALGRGAVDVEDGGTAGHATMLHDRPS